MQIFDLISTIEPLNKELLQKAKSNWDSLAKPLNGMGVLEDYICKMVAINNLDVKKRCAVVFCADNGVVAEGVTQTSSDVTAVVAQNIQKGDATICHMAKVANIEVFALDVGMNTSPESVPQSKSRNGTENFAKKPAMAKSDVYFAIETGIKTAQDLKQKGYGLIVAGEMGIGNTTTSSAILAAVLGVDANLVTGKGAGLSKSGVEHKINVINNALQLHKPLQNDAVDILAKVGGLDIAAMCGMFLGAGIYKMPIIMDGFIASVAAVLASMLNINVKDYIIPSHCSAENGAQLALQKLDVAPALHLSMALGEGTGAVALVPLLDMAIAVYEKMIRFEQTQVEAYKPL